MTRTAACLDPLGDPTRPEWKPYTVRDLCSVTGWSRPTVYGAIEAGTLPGYQSGPGGKWAVPAAAFRALCAGTWVPQPRELVISTPSPMLHRVATRRVS